MNASTKSRRFASLKTPALYLAALVVIVLVLAWQGDMFKQKMAPGEVEDTRPRAEASETVEVREMKLPVHRLLSGTLMPRETVELGSQIAGRVLDVDVEAGDTVDEGQTLLRIDPDLPKARRAEAEAALEMAEADLKGLTRLLSQVEAAAEAKVLPRTEAIDARRLRNRAAAAVDRSRAALEAADTRLGYTELSSPLSGVVIDTLRDPGDLVAPGPPVLLLYDPARIEVVVSVPSRLIGLLKPGREVECEIEDLDLSIPGVVRTLVPQVDPATRTVMVKLEIEPPPGALPGMYVRVRIEEHPEETLVVPGSAVGSLRGLRYAHIVNADGRVVKRLVRPGRRSDGQVEILAGLEAGDRVLREYGRFSVEGDAE